MEAWSPSSPSLAPSAARRWRFTSSPMCAGRWCRIAKSAVTRGTFVSRAAASPARWRSRVAMSKAARVAVVILTAAATPSTQERPLPDLEPFLKEVRARLETDASRQFGYSYLETRRRTSIDGKGRRRDEPVTVVESYPGLPGEDERWERVIERDGKRVPEPELRKADEDRRKKAERVARTITAQTP